MSNLTSSDSPSGRSSGDPQSSAAVDPLHDHRFDATLLVRRMGHDFNNLFSIVLGGLSLLREEIPESAWNNDADEIYADVVSATREAAGVIVQLTAWAARQSIDPQNTALNDVIEQAGLLLRRALPETIELEIAPAASASDAWVDRARLLDVLLELAANARAAMPNGGTLKIEHIAGAQPQVIVTDTGTGMSESVRAQCTQPYFTTGESSTHRGLGLSVIDGFMRASDAQMRINSDATSGTQIVLTFPPARGPEKETSG